MIQDYGLILMNFSRKGLRIGQVIHLLSCPREADTSIVAIGALEN